MPVMKMYFTNAPSNYIAPVQSNNNIPNIYTQNASNFNLSIISRIYNAKPGCSSCGRH
jgi:hypothetical protein